MDKSSTIKSLRESTGMNRKEFCEFFRIPYRTVTEWERDVRHAPDYVIRLLSYYIRMKKWKNTEGVKHMKDENTVSQMTFDDDVIDEEFESKNNICKVEESFDDNGTNGSSALDMSSYKNKTLKDYLELPDDVRVELIDGVFYDMASPTTSHQDIAGEIFTQLKNYIKANKGPCKPYISPIDVQLDCDDKTIVQPDIIVVCDKNKITKPRIVGAPDFVAEVMSRSSWYHDTVRKLWKYRNAGVREYWIVMPDNEKILAYYFEKAQNPIEYTFEDEIPVNIWNGDLKINLKEL